EVACVKTALGFNKKKPHPKTGIPPITEIRLAGADLCYNSSVNRMSVRETFCSLISAAGRFAQFCRQHKCA
ncbi:MAG: hypothetical protein ACI4UY_07870, partial [Kiritimatiellia bacterium]